jgi:cell division septal protein FtsQ
MSKVKVKRKTNGRKHSRNIGLLWLALGGVLVIGLAFLVFQASKPAPKASVEVKGSPRLKVDKDKVDLGNEKLGSPVTVSFSVTNAGDQPLRFSEQPYIEVVEGC